MATIAAARTAYIALGSNLVSEHGNRAQILCAASDRLGRLGRLAARSSLYETEPVGYRDQPAFLNAVVALRTQWEPLPLLRALLAIERELGRDRSQSVPNGPRTLDLDLLVLGDCIVTGRSCRCLTQPWPSAALCSRRWLRLRPICAYPTESKPCHSSLPCCPMRATIASPQYAGSPSWPSRAGPCSKRFHEMV